VPGPLRHRPRCPGRGLPVFADGVVELAAGVAHFAIDHPRVRQLADLRRNGVPGLLWTTASPGLSGERTHRAPRQRSRH
jgi:hypothetical protein